MLKYRTVWVYECQPERWLFRGNPNTAVRKDVPPFHLGGLYELINGHELVYAETRKGLEMEIAVAEWNLFFPQFKVKPKCIMFTWKKHYNPKRAAK